jgi:hypothetical protein
MRHERDADATTNFRAALAVDPQDNVALRLLSEIRLRAGDPKKLSTLPKERLVVPMLQRLHGSASVERANGNKLVLELFWTGHLPTSRPILRRCSKGLTSLILRSMNCDCGLKECVKVRPNDKIVLSRLAYAYQQAGRTGSCSSR